MNSDDYLVNLKSLEKEYKSVKSRIDNGVYDNEKDLVQLHVVALDLCEKIIQGTDGSDGRWKRRKVLHEAESESILNKLERKKKAEVESRRVSAGNGDKKETTVDEKELNDWFKKTPKHSLADVAGMKELKEKLISFVKKSEKKGLFEFLKMETLSSIIFYGPPGCGKTFIIEAFIHELMKKDYKFMSVDAPDILDKYQGESESKVKALFQAAEDNAPCIFFIDEIDNLCMDRRTKDIPPHKISLLETFLTSYNKLLSSGKEVFFVAATNFPHKIDSAMLNRMEKERVWLPDDETKLAFLRNSFKDIEIQFDEGVSFELILKDLKGYSLRDIKTLVKNIKEEIISETERRSLDADASIEAIKSGEIKITVELYQRVLKNTIFIPMTDYLRELEQWEDKMGIRGKGSKDDKDEKGDRQDYISKKGMKAYGLHDDSKTYVWDENRNVEAGDQNPFNAEPYNDTKNSYYAAKKYFENSEVCSEAIRRYYEVLKGQQAAEYGSLQEIDNELLNIKAELTRWEIPATIFEGMQGSSFLSAYDDFFTLLQGNSVKGFGGTCGIIASCNVVNQQNGTKLTEADGVREFCDRNLCVKDQDYCANGGTSILGRSQFIESRDLSFTFAVHDMIDPENPENMHADLENLAKYYADGYSIILSVKAQDLLQPGLSSREIDIMDYLKILVDPNITEEEVQMIMVQPYFANHALTVAGFSYSDSGDVIGVWINDTGGFGHGSNRIFITKEKYDLMRNNTVGLSVEFIKKSGYR